VPPPRPRYLFRTSSGAQVERNNLSRAFRQALAGTEYEGWVTPKTFRHSVAQAIVNGLTPETAQRLLGHASLATTLGFYAEQPVDRIDVSEFLDGAFANVDADDLDDVL
jgi:site-specific recombinase XerD